jgi:hypothetical protein
LAAGRLGRSSARSQSTGVGARIAAANRTSRDRLFGDRQLVGKAAIVVDAAAEFLTSHGARPLDHSRVTVSDGTVTYFGEWNTRLPRVP